MTKKELRKVLLTRQKGLPEAYVSEAGDAIQARVLALPEYAAARKIFLYVSLPREPGTDRILRHALANGKEVYVPKCVRREMLAVRIRGREELTPGTLGIPEPRAIQETCAAADFDLILVPCVSAWRDGRRLGHGGGYYDRYLPRCRGCIPRISAVGISYWPQ